MPFELDLKLRLQQDDAIAIGPGKADLLEAIARTGSISAAGRQKGGGARVTETGMLVLQRYRAMEAAARAAVEVHAGELTGLLREGGPT
jgi:molybdate transport system regulatory protein